MSEWFEKEDFWTNFGPIMFDQAHWAEAPAVADRVKKIAGLKDGDAILDAGCGVGRISVELAAIGLKVTGTDIIQTELDTAKESAKDEGVQIDFIKADMRSWCRPEAFDCVVNLYTSFGYCDSQTDDMKYLKNMCDCVKKGGTFILECTSREIAAMYFTEGEWFDRAGFTVLTDFGVVGAWEGLRSHWILIDKNGKRIEHEFVQRLYPAAFLRDKLLEFGMKSVEIYGDYEQNPYNHKATTMVLVGRK